MSKLDLISFGFLILNDVLEQRVTAAADFLLRCRDDRRFSKPVGYGVERRIAELWGWALVSRRGGCEGVSGSLSRITRIS